MNLNITSRTNLNKFTSTKPVFIWDTKLKGFGAKINPSGQHKYIVQYRNKINNKTKRITVGDVNITDLQAAKVIAKGILMDRLLLNQQENARREVMLGELLNEYVKNKQLKQLTIDDMKAVTIRFMGDILDVNIRMLTKDYVKDWYLAPEQKERAASTDKCFRYLKSSFQYAVGSGYIESNPFDIINVLGLRYKPVAKDNFLTPDELVQFWQAINSRYDNPKYRSAPATLDMIKLYILSAMRRGEMYKASVVSADGTDFIFIPNTKNHKDHWIPITEQMKPLLYLLDNAVKLPMTIRKSLGGLSKEIGKVPMVTLHDCRRTNSSLMASQGVDSLMISRSLNHTLPGVTEKHYIQRDKADTLPAFNAVSQWIADHV